MINKLVGRKMWLFFHNQEDANIKPNCLHTQCNEVHTFHPVILLLGIYPKETVENVDETFMSKNSSIYVWNSLLPCP